MLRIESGDNLEPFRRLLKLCNTVYSIHCDQDGHAKHQADSEGGRGKFPPRKALLGCFTDDWQLVKQLASFGVPAYWVSAKKPEHHVDQLVTSYADYGLDLRPMDEGKEKALSLTAQYNTRLPALESTPYEKHIAPHGTSLTCFFSCCRH